VTALEALDVGPGDEVIVPGLTWVADATAVINLGATPVLTDIDETLGLSPDAVQSSISGRTKAIIVANVYSSMPDWDALGAVATQYGLPILEDSAQAHGAEWKGCRTGGLGDIAAFSFQQSKILTSGEGGIAVTANGDLYDRMKRIRCDGRAYITPPLINQLEVDEHSVTPVMGTNYCMSEIQAAMLCAGLKTLDVEIDRRLHNMDLLTRGLRNVPGVTPVSVLPQVTRRPVAQYALRLDRDKFATVDLTTLCAALEAELGISIDRSDAPLNSNPLYQPHTKRRFAYPGRTYEEIRPSRFDLPEADKEHSRLVLIKHPAFLAESRLMQTIADAFEKVQSLAHTLRRARDN